MTGETEKFYVNEDLKSRVAHLSSCRHNLEIEISSSKSNWPSYSAGHPQNVSQKTQSSSLTQLTQLKKRQKTFQRPSSQNLVYATDHQAAKLTHEATLCDVTIKDTTF